MNDLLFTPQNNLGGLYLLGVVPAYGVASIPSADSRAAVAESDVVMRTGFHFVGVYGTEGTKQLVSAGKTDDNGRYYENKVRCFLPGSSVDHQSQLADWLDNCPLLIRIEDNNDNLRLVGTLAQPMWLTEVTFDTTDQITGRHGTQLVFEGQTRFPALFLVPSGLLPSSSG